MADKESDIDIGEMSVLLIILCICLSCTYGVGRKIYDLYHTYTFLEKHEINSLDDVKVFFKEMFYRLWLWIQCNILGLFSEKYKRQCFTGALIISPEDETKLDSAEPGSLAEALLELEENQKRQTEDYERANYDLNQLEQAIRDKDAEAIFIDSDLVEMDEEALYWRAWITAQTAQMTHNLINMEICDENSKVKDYMDLAATGLDKKGHLIEGKTGKNFRWSNRCMNTSNIALGSTTHCPNISGEGNDAIKEKYWIDEIVPEHVESGSNLPRSEPCESHDCLDPSGTSTTTPISTVHPVVAPVEGTVGAPVEKAPVENDIQAFHLGNFSGYNCKLYEAKYCADGYPDYDNYADMFGVNYNWPELNCCACGGGSRNDTEPGTDTVKPKTKYEFISTVPLSIPSKTVSETSDTGTAISVSNTDIPFFNSESVQMDPEEQFTYTLTDATDSDTMKECMDECSEDSTCRGLVFENCGYDPVASPYNEHYTPSLFNPHNLNSEKRTSNFPFLYNPGTCKKVITDRKNSDVFFNRNDIQGKIIESPQFNKSVQTRLLKKMPNNYQNLTSEGKSISEDLKNNTGYGEYDLDYDKPVDLGAMGTMNTRKAANQNAVDVDPPRQIQVNTCSQWCNNLDGYKSKVHDPCGDSKICTRKMCCDIKGDEDEDEDTTDIKESISPTTLLQTYNTDHYCNITKERQLSCNQDYGFKDSTTFTASNAFNVLPTASYDTSEGVGAEHRAQCFESDMGKYMYQIDDEKYSGDGTKEGKEIPGSEHKYYGDGIIEFNSEASAQELTAESIGISCNTSNKYRQDGELMIVPASDGYWKFKYPCVNDNITRCDIWTEQQGATVVAECTQDDTETCGLGGYYRTDGFRCNMHSSTFSDTCGRSEDDHRTIPDSIIANESGGTCRLQTGGCGGCETRPK